jgi:hypothetical protein
MTGSLQDTSVTEGDQLRRMLVEEFPNVVLLVFATKQDLLMPGAWPTSWSCTYAVGAGPFRSSMTL